MLQVKLDQLDTLAVDSPETKSVQTIRVNLAVLINWSRLDSTGFL